MHDEFTYPADKFQTCPTLKPPNKITPVSQPP